MTRSVISFLKHINISEPGAQHAAKGVCSWGNSAGPFLRDWLDTYQPLS